MDIERCDKDPGGCVLGHGRYYRIGISSFTPGEWWKPTLELRVLRTESRGGSWTERMQQRWERVSPTSGDEWRDVPVHIEKVDKL
jgi:hypothetical protein